MYKGLKSLSKDTNTGDTYHVYDISNYFSNVKESVLNNWINSVRFRDNLSKDKNGDEVTTSLIQ